ncbi:MAG: antitoxin [Chloroflexi bacterium]|nr:antitoxin [Chloroflexota bacterium]MCA2001268.1 antitoxin [Chloroflexota bacterium]
MKANALAERIRQELNDLNRALARIKEGWERARRSNDDYYLDAVALNLHSVYSGFERIFTHIAETIDGGLPSGDNWHLLLLRQMKKEVAGMRPAVISSEVEEILDELRRFRHLIRNVYTHNLDPERLGKLVLSTLEKFPQLNAELLAFAAFVESLGNQ